MALHTGIRGNTQVLLACFGLSDTDDRLRELGLSRLVTDNVRTIGTLRHDDASEAVRRTVARIVNDHRFDEGPADEQIRKGWIDATTEIILSESACFPHHMTNGYRALAKVLLQEGIGNRPPSHALVADCRRRKRDYYEERLKRWATHTPALALAFGSCGNNGWVPHDVVESALMASDRHGRPVKSSAAMDVLREMEHHGYIQSDMMGGCRPTLPSLAGHFAEIASEITADNKVALAIRAAAGVDRQGALASALTDQPKRSSTLSIGR